MVFIGVHPRSSAAHILDWYLTQLNRRRSLCGVFNEATGLGLTRAFRPQIRHSTTRVGVTDALVDGR
jgi:hypothetical protein